MRTLCTLFLFILVPGLMELYSTLSLELEVLVYFATGTGAKKKKRKGEQVRMHAMHQNQDVMLLCC